VQYLEPRTDVPAIHDWSTALALRDKRFSAEQWVHSVVVVVTFVVCFFLPMTAGNVAAVIVLAFLLLTNVVGLASSRAKRRGLLDEPWRRLPATVAENDDEPWDVLLVDGLVLKGSFHDLPDMVLDRQEVFVCGPDAQGRAVIRAAGFTAMRPAEVGAGEYRARQRVDRPLGRPLDDPAVRRVLDATWIGPVAWVTTAVTLVVVGVLVALSVSPLAPAGLVTAGLVAWSLLDVPAMVVAIRRQREAERAVRDAERWTPVPIRLFPEKAGHHVAGVAELPGGPALVRFPVPVLDVVANIAATGVMWIAGTHRDLLAVGVPHVNALTYAVVRPHGVARDGDPMSWYRRLRPRKLLGLP
jgi:hypothetical protein